MLTLYSVLYRDTQQCTTAVWYWIHYSQHDTVYSLHDLYKPVIVVRSIIILSSNSQLVIPYLLPFNELENKFDYLDNSRHMILETHETDSQSNNKT